MKSYFILVLLLLFFTFGSFSIATESIALFPKGKSKQTFRIKDANGQPPCLTFFGRKAKLLSIEIERDKEDPEKVIFLFHLDCADGQFPEKALLSDFQMGKRQFLEANDIEESFFGTTVRISSTVDLEYDPQLGNIKINNLSLSVRLPLALLPKSSHPTAGGELEDLVGLREPLSKPSTN